MTQLRQKHRTITTQTEANVAEWMALKRKIEIVTIISEVVFKKFKRGLSFRCVSFLTETAKIEKKQKAKKFFLKKGSTRDFKSWRRNFGSMTKARMTT